MSRPRAVQGLPTKAKGYFQLKSLDSKNVFHISKTLSNGPCSQCRPKEVGRLTYFILILSFSSGKSRGKIDWWRLFADHTSLNQSTVLDFRNPGKPQGSLCAWEGESRSRDGSVPHELSAMRREAEGCDGFIHTSAVFLQGRRSLLLQCFQDITCASIMGLWNGAPQSVSQGEHQKQVWRPEDQYGGMSKLQGKGTGTPSLLTTQTLSLSLDSPTTSMHTKSPLPSLLGR